MKCHSLFLLENKKENSLSLLNITREYVVKGSIQFEIKKRNSKK